MHLGAVYIRVSTAGQTDGSSLDRQREECLALAKQNGFDVPERLIFKDVMSGRREDRPGFQQLLTAAAAGEFTRVYVWTVDRFGRSLRTAVNAVDDLRKAGVTPISVKEGDLSDEIRFAMLSAMAAREAERIRERTLPAKLRKRDAGFFVTGRHPFGYRKRADKSLEKCPVESRIVRQIFRDCINGLGRVAVARRLNDAQALPLEAKVRINGKLKRVRPGNIVGEAGKPLGFVEWCEAQGAEVVGLPQWHSRAVTRVLDNSAAYGVLLSGQSPAPIALTIADGPIIQKSEFEAAQRARKDRIRAGRRMERPWLLTGRIVCGSCGQSYMHHEGRARHYYRCVGRRSGKGCTSPHVVMLDADRAAILAVRDMLRRHFGSELKIEAFLADQGRKDRDRLALVLAGLETDRAQAQDRWEGAQRDLEDVLKAGGRRSSMPAIVGQVEDAKRSLDELLTKITVTKDAINDADAGLQATAAELQSVIKRIERAAEIVVGSGDEEEETIDVLAIVRGLVDRAEVRPDRSVSVVLKDTVAAVRGVLNQIASAAVEGERQDIQKALSSAA